MDNYHYIIAGLPDLILDFDSQNFSYSNFKSVICQQLSDKDKRLIDWLEFGYNEENLSRHYYREVAKSKNTFLSQYPTFDKTLRNAQARFLAKQLGKDETPYIIGNYDSEYEEFQRVSTILDNPNIIERERQMDKLRWDKISEINTFEYFNMNVILAFLAKARIVQRWSALDKAEGARLFEQLVQEVRGTFKGINLKK